MKAYILCPGPSLNAHSGSNSDWGDPGVVICVNKARNYVDCHDWWVAGDAGKTEELMVDDSTKKGVFSVYAVPVRSYLQNPLWKDLQIDPTWYSSIAALRLAFHLKATEIHVYGHDMTGSTYYDGTDIGMEPVGRWGREVHLWDNEVSNLKELYDIKVTRH